MKCSSTSTTKSFCEIVFLYIFPIPAPYVIAHIRKLSPAYFLSLLPCLSGCHTSWIFSILCFAFASAFRKISLYFCHFVSLWFSAFMSFKCSLFLSTGNVRSSSLVSFVIHVQTAVYTGQVQDKLNSSICWKQLCTCSSQRGDENLCHVLGAPWNKMRVVHPHFSNPWESHRSLSSGHLTLPAA